ncbi:NAD(P)H-binding protein [Rothia sp. ZJ1223]|uniref:NAD-dependent epimerase/dehydratase family protein n=1 Tax=Rothia sp. ZJ1223 TaxID=2811098 RepID=UPI001957FFF2|nr:NAD(P)H-binding protein [Rothia sp. ZJ1223]MBM7052284.1 NAD(P)H-binding protein [Rothia sp. ZJ1223]
MKILLTGASGYIGRNLLKELKKNHEIIVVSRSTENKENEKNVTWVAADLFAPEDNERVMKDIDLAVYLVHSMQPPAKLTQASFEDMDALLADNFARAAANNGVKRIVYLSGIVPENEKLSRHLASRLECEKILSSHGVPVTTLRAGLIVGPKGSSFPILQSLVERLPGLVLPSWAYNRTHPVALRDLIEGLLAAIEREDLGQCSIDIGGPEEITYRELFEQTAEVLGKKLPMVDLPIIPVWAFKLWVALISGKPIEMVGPLLDSLVHDLVITPEHTVEGITNAPTGFKESVRLATEGQDSTGYSLPRLRIPFKSDVENPKNDVKSIQRVTIPASWSVQDTASYYLKWLSRASFKVVGTRITDNRTEIFLPLLKEPILILQHSPQRSSEDAVVYLISGGLFARTAEGSRARLAFRRVLGENRVIIAIHEYEPSLPWTVYTLTQARVHLIVMTIFGYETKALAALENFRENRGHKPAGIAAA